MSVSHSPRSSSRTAARKRHSPRRDALFAAFLIFAGFSGSALWIYFQARDRELSHHMEALSDAAVRTANAVGTKYFAGGSSGPAPTKDERNATMTKLAAVRARSSPVGRVSVIGPSARGPLVLFDTDQPSPPPEDNWLTSPTLPVVPEEEKSHFEEVMARGKLKAHSRQDRTIKVYAPVRGRDGRVVGVATAESSTHTLEQGLRPIRMAALSSVALGAALSLLAALAIYSWRRGAWKVEERLARAEQADRLIVQALGQVFYEYDPATDAMTWRGETSRIFGQEADQVAATGLEWEERIHPADRELFRRTLSRVSAAEPFGIEYRVRRADGRYVWLMDRGGVLSDDDEKRAIMGVMFDMTDLRETEERLRDVVDAAGEYIWEVDAQGRYTYVSDRVREVLGRTPEEMIGREPFDFLPDDEQAEVRRKSQGLQDSKRSFRGFEHRVIRADGRVIWISVNGVASFDANGNFAGYRGAGMDITGRKEAEQALIREKEAANAAVRAKSQFLAMMSHEIRTPLNSVIGFADLLSTSELDETQRLQLEMICKSGDALLELLNDILDFSRLESAALSLDVGRVPVRAALQEVIDLYHATAAAKKVELSLEVEPEVPEAIQTDRARLRQILLNLVGNAVKFTERGSVRVRARVKATENDAEKLCIEIRDTGVGVPEEKRHLLFQPFSQVDSSTTRRFGGTGLGLAICKRLAELLGGEVGLRESGPGGSLFYVELPAEIAEEAMKGVEPTGGVEGGKDFRLARPLRVLVAEDNRVNLLLIRKMLMVLGIESEAAEDGDICVKMHEANPFDVILMDVQMPVLDGLSATRRIREREKNEGVAPVKIIALTANAMAGDRERCLESGMDDYLSKPIRLKALALLFEKYSWLVREEPVSG